ncbi:hypothetical protein M2373_003346 [Chryseobacterium sp. JUb7]|nr:hypothetical protein [Chryseobacterium sp. JUb7]
MIFIKLTVYNLRIKPLIDSKVSNKVFLNFLVKY